MGFNLFLLFTISYFLHLTSRSSGLGALRFDLILYFVLSILALMRRGSKGGQGANDRITKALLLFFACAMISVPLAMWPGSVLRFGLPNFLKSVTFFLFLVSFIQTEKQLKVFMLVFLGCQVFRGLEPAYLHLTQGYWGDFATSSVGGEMVYLDRLSGAPHDIVNPNQLAWVILNTVPFIYYLGFRAQKKILRLGATVLLVILLYPLMLTGSRTGIVCLFMIILGITFLGENRWKRIAMMCLVVMPLFLVMSTLLSPDMAERYLSLVDSSAVGSDTAAGRITGLKSNLEMALNIHGVFGHGLGTSTEVHFHHNGSAQMPHDLYIEALVEVGIVGLLFFLRYVFVILSCLRQVKSRLLEYGKEGFSTRMIMGLQVWIFMDLIYSLACFGYMSWEWYLFGGLAVVTIRLSIVTNGKTNDTSVGVQSHFIANENGSQTVVNF